ncbi:uncharacterized protein TNCT_708171 [Trichonephila clavata]|uniref:Uncharacterized protein n=2 Tax=Trichonephila clavata TaxID=2740835 RepID=A0A8X6KN55_TRICU|nr:uncharacterized protein TNCT_708171 [Trichonephila clavata]
MKNNPNQTFKKKEEFRKPFPIKKSQPVGGYHDNHSPGPSRTVPRFPSSRTEGRKPIQCYGCGTPGVVKSKCPTCTRTNEIETEVNCMTLFNLNSDLYPSSVIVLKIFGEKIAVCADTGASHTIAGEKLFKFLQEHGITFTNKVISFMMSDGIRQTITALRTVIDLYIEGKVIPTEFLVLPEAKGNKTLLGLDFLNAAGIVLDVQGGKWHFSENPRKQYIFFKKTLKDLNIKFLNYDDSTLNNGSNGTNILPNTPMEDSNSMKNASEQKQRDKRHVASQPNYPQFDKKHHDKRSVLVLKQQTLEIQVPDHPPVLIQTPERVEQKLSNLHPPNNFHIAEEPHEEDYDAETEQFYPRIALARLTGGNEENVQPNEEPHEEDFDAHTGQFYPRTALARLTGRNEENMQHNGMHHIFPPNNFHTAEEPHEEDFDAHTGQFYPRTAVARLTGRNKMHRNKHGHKPGVDIIIEKKIQKDSVADVGQKIIKNTTQVKMSVTKSLNQDQGIHQNGIAHEPHQINDLMSNFDENKNGKYYSPIKRKASEVSSANGGETLQEVFEKDEKIQETDPITGTKEESRKVIRKTSNTISENLPRNVESIGKKSNHVMIMQPQEENEDEIVIAKRADKNNEDESNKIFPTDDSGTKLVEVQNINKPKKRFMSKFGNYNVNPFRKNMKYPSLTMPYENMRDHPHSNISIPKSVSIRAPQQNFENDLDLENNPFLHGFPENSEVLPETEYEYNDLSDELQEPNQRKRTLEILLPSNILKRDEKNNNEGENFDTDFLKHRQDPHLQDIENSFIQDQFSNYAENIPYLSNNQKSPDYQIREGEMFPNSHIKRDEKRVQIELHKLPFEIEVNDPNNHLQMIANKNKRYATPLTTSTSKEILSSKKKRSKIYQREFKKKA